MIGKLHQARLPLRKSELMPPEFASAEKPWDYWRGKTQLWRELVDSSPQGLYQLRVFLTIVK
jgi:hypothetical protein